MSQEKIIQIIKEFLIKIYALGHIFKFIRYSIVGGSGALIDFFFFFLFFEIIGLYYIYALALSISISGIISFTLHKHFTFKNKSNQYPKQISKFIFVMIISTLLDFLLMYIFVDIILIYPLIARPITIFSIWFFNFTMHNFFTFRN